MPRDNRCIRHTPRSHKPSKIISGFCRFAAWPNPGLMKDGAIGKPLQRFVLILLFYLNFFFFQITFLDQETNLQCCEESPDCVQQGQANNDNVVICY